jgi:uncharacterized protein YrrD
VEGKAMITNLRSGTDIVDAATGARLGRVHAVYLDPVRREVAGFSLRRGGLFWRVRPGLIDLATVRRYGPEAVEVMGRAAFGASGRDPAGAGLIALDELARRPVRLEDGTVLGRVAAVRFCADSRRLVGLDVDPDGLPLCRMLLGADQVVRLGPDAVVVRESAAAATQPGALRPVRVAHCERSRRVA